MSPFIASVMYFLWEIAKIALSIGAARVAFIIYGYKKGIFIDSH